MSYSRTEYYRNPIICQGKCRWVVDKIIFGTKFSHEVTKTQRRFVPERLYRFESLCLCGAGFDSGVSDGIHKKKAGRQTAPKKTAQTSFQGYRGYRAAVYRLLAVARVAGSGADDPCFVVPQFEDLGTEFGAETATNAEFHINNRCCHSYSHPFLK
jgi:hypothetical protein